MIDLLIVGSGGAGLSTALEAKKSIDNIVVLSKTYPTASQTSQAQGGINAVLDEKNDSVDAHFADTMKSAHGIGDENSIKYLCENAKENIQWLDDIGVPFSRDEENNIARRKLGGAKHPRACYSSDYTGLKILHTLYDNCIKEGIEFINEHMLLDFIVEDETIKGITALEIKTGEVKQILAKTVVVASGGYAGIYDGYTTNSTATTGDAIAAAFRAGCELSNMEYVQFHPTSLKNNCILISESARGEGGYLVTDDGDRFVDELRPRDEVARAIYEKQLEGHEIYLDLRHLGYEKIMETMPQEYDLAYNFAHLKLDQDLIPIMPAAHYTMGGIKADINGKTNIKNLFAIGECSSNGVHGANRLGGNSLLEIITFGRKIASYISENVNLDEMIEEKEYEKTKEDIDFIDSLFEYPNGINFYDKKKELGELFYKKVGLFRVEDELLSAKEDLLKLKEEYQNMGLEDKSKVYNTNLKEFIEFKNILDVSYFVVISALSRQESRGAHYRVDMQNENPDFSKDTVLIKDGENIVIKDTE